MKTALHYDGQLGAGIILNLTLRNVGRKNMRFIASIDLAQQLKLKLHYRLYKRSGQFSRNFYYLLENSSFNFMQKQTNISQLLNDKFQSIQTGVQCNIGMKAGFYRGLFVELNRLLPKYETGFIDGINIKEWNNLRIGYGVKLDYNTLDHPLVPKRGIDAFISARLNFISYQVFNYTYFYADSALSILTSEPHNYNNTMFGFSKIQAKFKLLSPINKSISILSNFNMGINNYDNPFKFIDLESDSINHPKPTDKIATAGLPELESFYLGGINQRSQINNVPVWGLNERELPCKNFMSLQLGVQLEVLHKLFLTPAFTYIYKASDTREMLSYIVKPGFNNEVYTTQHGSYAFLYTYGIGICYKSLVGPMVLNISKSSKDKIFGAYITMGYTF